MKFLVTSDCYRSGGRTVNAGTVLTDATEDEIRDLSLAGRGHPVAEPVEITGDGAGEALPPADNTPKIGKTKK